SATTSYVFQPRRKQAEFCATNSGLGLAYTSDPYGGGLDVIALTNGSYISFYPVNLTSITGVTYRVSCSGIGGRIEARMDSPTGALLSTANVPSTGGVYSNLNASISNPGGTHTLYFVFLRNPGDTNLFVLNWLEFQGPGLSLSPTPFGGTARALPGTIQAEDFDNGGEGVAYHDVESANYGGAYRTSEGVDIQGTSDTGGGYNVGWMAPGEWLKYSVNFSASGLYTLSGRIATVES